MTEVAVILQIINQRFFRTLKMSRKSISYSVFSMFNSPSSSFYLLIRLHTKNYFFKNKTIIAPFLFPLRSFHDLFRHIQERPIQATFIYSIFF